MYTFLSSCHHWTRRAEGEEAHPRGHRGIAQRPGEATRRPTPRLARLVTIATPAFDARFAAGHNPRFAVPSDVIEVKFMRNRKRLFLPLLALALICAVPLFS